MAPWSTPVHVGGSGAPALDPVAAEELCFYLHNSRARTACVAPWLSTNGSTCLTQLLQQHAAASDDQRIYKRAILNSCWLPALEEQWWLHVRPGALHRALSRYRTAVPRIWIAIEVRQQAASLPYWLVWHLLLGVEHILVYNNDNFLNYNDLIDSKLLLEAVAPFVTDGYATVIPFEADGNQIAAYEDAVARASAAGVDFVGALDADEFAAPFADRTLGALLGKCQRKVPRSPSRGSQSCPREYAFNNNGAVDCNTYCAGDWEANTKGGRYCYSAVWKDGTSAGCRSSGLLQHGGGLDCCCTSDRQQQQPVGWVVDHRQRPPERIMGCSSVKINWRWTTRAHGIDRGKGYYRNFWEYMHFDIGEANEHVKSFVRVATHGTFGEPHQASPKAHLASKFAPYRDDMSLAVPRSPWESPKVHSAQRAVILHARCSTLSDWVSRRSLRGRADVPGALHHTSADGCGTPTCGSRALQAIIREFQQLCSVTHTATQTGGHTRPSSQIEQAVQMFTRHHDARVGYLIANVSGPAAGMLLDERVGLQPENQPVRTGAQ